MAKKKGSHGHPGSSGQAQSGGINRTFGGGKGGTKESRTSTNERKIGSGRLNNGLGYNVRTAAGDRALVPFHETVGSTPPATTGGIPQEPVKIRPPHRGGSK